MPDEIKPEPGPLHWLIIFIAVSLRLLQYFAGLSLRPDEAYLALNLLSRSFAEMLQPLDQVQFAPPLFSFFEKCSIFVFGEGEMALRLFPLLAGLLSVYLFALFVSRFLQPLPGLVALFLFATSRDLIYFSSDLKPYSSDVLVFLLLALATLRVDEKKTWASVFWLTLAGAFCLWLSFPAPIILLACGLYLLYCCRVERDPALFKKVILPLSVWLLSFLILYKVTLADNMASELAQSYWKPYFFPMGAELWQQFAWFGTVSFEFAEAPMRLSRAGLTLPLLLAGAIFMASRGRRQALLPLFVFAAALLMAVLNLYPFANRLVLFLMPAALILLTVGLCFLVWVLRAFHPALAVIFVLVFLFHPFYKTMHNVLNPLERNEIRQLKEMLGHLKKNLQKGDVIYLEFGIKSTSMYYLESHKLEDLKLNFLSGPHNNVYHEVKAPEPELKLFEKRRVWVLNIDVSSLQNKKEPDKIYSPIRRQLLGKLQKSRGHSDYQNTKFYELWLFPAKGF